MEKHIKHSKLSKRDRAIAIAAARYATAEVIKLQLVEFDF
jgi:hypothetical protein